MHSRENKNEKKEQEQEKLKISTDDMYNCLDFFFEFAKKIEINSGESKEFNRQARRAKHFWKRRVGSFKQNKQFW